MNLRRYHAAIQRRAGSFTEAARRRLFRRRVQMIEELSMWKYILDLQGYIVIENVLTCSELASLNEIFEREHARREDETGARFAHSHAPDSPGFLQWGKPLCDLLDHPRTMPILRFRLGEKFRLDRLYATEGRTVCGRLHADYGASSPNAKSSPGEYYHFDRHEVMDGFMVVSWNLSDTGPDQGGFCCIPGSHKSNYRVPETIANAPQDSPHVVIPSAPAGSVIMFTEALTHGATVWKAKHPRRTLIYKYCVSHMAWRPRRVMAPTTFELTPRQQILLREPADARHFPSLFEDA